jgi:ActD protein
MRDRDWKHGVFMAEFESAESLTSAVRTLNDKGYTLLETYSPVPLDVPVKRSRTRLPLVVFVAGVLGGVLSYAIQWYANAYTYPLDIGGRPAQAVPAFIIPTFEGTILCASLAAFIGFFVIARLPQPWHPVFEIDGFERASVDRYWIAVDASDHRAAPDLTPRELRALSPLRVVMLGPWEP